MLLCLESTRADWHVLMLQIGESGIVQTPQPAALGCRSLRKSSFAREAAILPG